jgi:hypothetical protein
MLGPRERTHRRERATPQRIFPVVCASRKASSQHTPATAQKPGVSRSSAHTIRTATSMARSIIGLRVLAPGVLPILPRTASRNRDDTDPALTGVGYSSFAIRPSILIALCRSVSRSNACIVAGMPARPSSLALVLPLPLLLRHQMFRFDLQLGPARLAHDGDGRLRNGCDGT